MGERERGRVGEGERDTRTQTDRDRWHKPAVSFHDVIGAGFKSQHGPPCHIRIRTHHTAAWSLLWALWSFGGVDAIKTSVVVSFFSAIPFFFFFLHAQTSSKKSSLTA